MHKHSETKFYLAIAVSSDLILVSVCFHRSLLVIDLLICKKGNKSWCTLTSTPPPTGCLKFLVIYSTGDSIPNTITSSPLKVLAKTKIEEHQVPAKINKKHGFNPKLWKSKEEKTIQFRTEMQNCTKIWALGSVGNNTSPAPAKNKRVFSSFKCLESHFPRIFQAERQKKTAPPETELMASNLGIKFNSFRPR